MTSATRRPPGKTKKKTNRPARQHCWETENSLLMTYHDHEWGIPTREDRALFEHLVLGGFQAGLSWSTILNKRVHFQKAFHGFDPIRVAKYGDRDRKRLLADVGIVRNRAKIDAAIRNADAFLRAQEEFGSFSEYAWRFVGGKPIRRKHPNGKTPVRTSESDAFSEDLKKRGFQFVGSTIIYAFMQSVGMVNDHLSICWKSKK